MPAMATQSDGGDLTRPEPVREAGYRAAEQGADCTGSDALRLAHRNSASRRRRAARSPPAWRTWYARGSALVPRRGDGSRRKSRRHNPRARGSNAPCVVPGLLVLGGQQMSDHSFRHCPIFGGSLNLGVQIADRRSWESGREGAIRSIAGTRKPREELFGSYMITGTEITWCRSSVQWCGARSSVLRR